MTIIYSENVRRKLASDTPPSLEIADMWCAGYLQGVRLRLKPWEPLRQEKGENADLLFPISAIADGIVVAIADRSHRWPNPSTLPADLDSLKRVAVTFAVTFSGAHKVETIEKYVPAYTDALASCRQRQATTKHAWDAFAEAMNARGKPLFGGAKAALSYLPGWKALREPARRTTETVLPD